MRPRPARGTALSFLVAACLLASCGDDSVNSPPAAEPLGYTADTSTRDAAQDSLGKAEHLLDQAGTARFDLSYPVGPEKASIEGRFSLSGLESEFVMKVPDEVGPDDSSLRTVLKRAEAFQLVTIDGKPQDCWFHHTRATGEGAETAAIPPFALMLIEPEAVGFLDGGTESEIVTNVLLDEATSAVFPKIVSAHVDEIPRDASIPALVRLKGDEYASLTFRLGDVLGALEEAGVDYLAGSTEVTRQSLDGIRGGEATIEYSAFGAAVDVEPPADDLVAELDRSDPEKDIEPCAAAR
ncbi:MAG TPA: hypothetical protein VNO51_14390, partial [Ilumatobacteraceae bacterium]|nr:hypothetical protein [Ilumatobacteraceae bacterium]